ncbi:hypothetical protein J5N97_028943 [Dioscorea zingiberensis]|uniref:Uncharacterized protein n=1 Tax=Dioscorea zingiberensis TaxID=325984 RepID=A0A9D5BZV0_9LILI|nr:hypothetical protein J5N97_028943 [Dioscorea zingiberensis]
MSYLDLSSNDLHGSISPLIDNMISLEVLKLSGNSHLEAPMLMTLGNLCKLKILGLSNVKITQKLNEFGGTFSGCIRNSLQNLNLQNTSLAGQLPTEIGNLRNLRFLNLGDNNLSGSIPKSFSQLLNLASLSLESNNLDSVLDEAFFTNLEHLNCRGGMKSKSIECIDYFSQNKGRGIWISVVASIIFLIYMKEI